MEHNFFLDNETAIRLSVFLGILALMATLESVLPRRPWVTSRANHWLNNLGIVIINSALLRLLFPVAAIGVAKIAQTNNWGLLNMIALPSYVEIIIGFVILDCVIYWQHVTFHKFPLLWRLHRMHHADQDFDVTTGSRFHPIEIIASMLVKFVAIILLGPPLLAVLFFEVVLNGAAMFNHSNVKFNKQLDRILRLLIVTPDMHRVHHSVLPGEYNSNFGFNLPWWDRLFGSYHAQPEAGHEKMTIGLNEYKDIKVSNRLDGMLLIPFKQ
jgi:sterol desaturase/sphingolipid hydroxylase (fatty acid hydroxylase superfamily)